MWRSPATDFMGDAAMRAPKAALAASALLLAACASGTYTAPPPPEFRTSKATGLTIEAAANAVLAGAPGLGYEVLETDPEAGTINLRFGGERPNRYVDCGRYVGSTGTTSFRGDWVTWATTTRKAQLTGLMQVRLEPVAGGHEGERTLASVRAGYALTLPASVAPGFPGADFSFASDGAETVTLPVVLPGDTAQRTCRPSGKAEEEILGLIG